MFSIGIEFSLRDLLREKWVALLGGPLGILLSVGLGMGVGTLLGWRPLQGVIIGIVISVASTMVLSRLLMDRGELHAAHGRVMIGITLVEDLAVVVLIVLMPALGALEPGRLVAIGLALAKAAAILVPFWFLAARIFPPLMTRVARTRNKELFLLVALAIGVGTAALVQGVGLSLALGAFLGGLIISESDYAHETLARLLPLRDAFVAMFFVALGTLINPGTLFANLPILAAMVGLTVLGKFLVWGVVVRLFGYPLQTALLVAVGLTQIGEFSFVLVQVARGAGHVGAEVYNATLAASLLTILLNAVLVRAGHRWIGRVGLTRRQRALSSPAAARGDLRDHVVLCGFGRVGSAVGEALETFAIRYIVIETDPDIVKGLHARGVPCLYGDAAHDKILEEAGGQRAALVVLTIPEGERARLAIHHLRAMNPQVPILARTHERRGHEGLREAGATEVVQPELEAAATLIRHALRLLLLPQDRILAYLDRFHEAMREAQGAGTPEEDALPQVREVTLGAGPLADQSMREARIRERFGVTIVAITRAGGDVLLNPSADTILRPGDRVRLFGLPDQMAAFLAESEGKA
jgi:CPA2 family monovalent cation:H+ antiporter-2